MECKYCGKNFRAKNAIFCSKNCEAYNSKALKRKNDLKSIRITFNMDRDISDSLRDIQSNLIKNNYEHTPFSQVVNQILREGLKTKKIAVKDI